MKIIEKVLFLACLSIFNGTALIAQNGQSDPLFGNGTGYVTTGFGQNFNRAYALALSTDGKLITAGSTQELADDDFGADFAVARFNEDGSPDAGFGTSGLIITDLNNGSSDVAQDVAIQGDGKIVVAGRSHDAASYENYHIALVRYNADGTLDQSFGSSGKVLFSYSTYDDYSYPLKMALQPDGKIVVAGTCYIAPYDRFIVVRFTSAGQPDASFGVNGVAITSPAEFTNGQAYTLKIQSDGKIVAGGLCQWGILMPTGVDFALIRYQSDGALDPSFGTGGIVTTPVADGAGYDWIEDLEILSDGKIMAMGNIDELQPSGSNLYSVALVKYQSDGSIDNTFGNSGKIRCDFGSDYPFATGVAITASGAVVLGGNVINQNGAYDFLVAKFTAVGLPFPGFGENGMTVADIGVMETGMDVKIQDNGKIVLAGITGDQDHQDVAVLRFLDDFNTGEGEFTGEDPIVAFPNPATDYITIRQSNNQECSLVILDMYGKKVFTGSLDSPEQRYDVRQLAQGYYVMQLRNVMNQKMYVIPFLKVK